MFDLDGTLLPLHVDEFLRRYMKKVASHFQDLIEPGKLIPAIHASTADMVRNLDPALTNRQAFAASFEPAVGMRWSEMWPGFLEFYEGEFRTIGEMVKDPGVARSAVLGCIEAGWEVVLATNPIFPLVAIKERMRWCKVDDLPWRFITHLDNMHYCKPHVQYYGEIRDQLRLEPESCVMVGNDVQEDMVASELGMKTYLVEGFTIDRGTGPEPDRRGPLDAVPEYIRSL